MPLIELRNLSAAYEDFVTGNSIPILAAVNLSLKHGQLCTILGPSGSGKSTLLKAIVGLAPVLEGDILIDGKSIKNVQVNKRNFGYVPQDPTLFQHLNVEKNIAFGLRARKLVHAEITKRVHEIAEIVGIRDILKKPVDQISGGEAQRVSLSRALAPNPQILLMDEPFSSLDITLRQRLALEYRRIQKELGVTAIHVTHDQGEARLLSDLVGVISEGTLSQIAPRDRIFSSPVNWRVAQTVGFSNVLSPSDYSFFGFSKGTEETFPHGGYLDPRKILLGLYSRDGLQAKIISSQLRKTDIVRSDFGPEERSHGVHVWLRVEEWGFLEGISEIPLEEGLNTRIGNFQAAFEPFGEK